MAKDMMLDENMDLVINPVTNEVEFEESAQQEMVLMMLTEPGEWPDPLAGLGLRKREKGQFSTDRLVNDIQDQAEYCQIKISRVEMEKVIKVFTD